MTTQAESFPKIATTDGRTVYTSTGEAIEMTGPEPRIVALMAACRRHSITQLWLVNYSATLELPPEDSEYDIQPRDPRAGWLHCFRRGVYGALELVQPGLDMQSPWGYASDAKELLTALQLYRSMVGVTFHRSASATGARLVKQLHTARGALPLEIVGDFPPPALDAGTESPLAWVRPLTDDERDGGMHDRLYLHSYDKNGAYLGACSSLEVGAGAVEHITDPDVINPNLPGYFLVSGVEPVASRIPAFTSSGRTSKTLRKAKGALAGVWVTTPTLRYLLDDWTRGMQLHEAYVWREHHRILDGWYKALRDARGTLLSSHLVGAPLALKAVKATYAGFAGGYMAAKASPKAPGWDRTDDPLYRPDVRHLIIATARCNLLRNVAKSRELGGPVPVAIGGIDTLYYVSDEPDPARALPAGLELGDGLKHYKVKDSVRFSQVYGLWEGSLEPASRLKALQDSLRQLQRVSVAADEAAEAVPA